MKCKVYSRTGCNLGFGEVTLGRHDSGSLSSYPKKPHDYLLNSFYYFFFFFLNQQTPPRRRDDRPRLSESKSGVESSAQVSLLPTKRGLTRDLRNSRRRRSHRDKLHNIQNPHHPYNFFLFFLFSLVCYKIRGVHPGDVSLDFFNFREVWNEKTFYLVCDSI